MDNKIQLNPCHLWDSPLLNTRCCRSQTSFLTLNPFSRTCIALVTKAPSSATQAHPLFFAHTSLQAARLAKQTPASDPFIVFGRLISGWQWHTSPQVAVCGCTRVCFSPPPVRCSRAYALKCCVALSTVRIAFMSLSPRVVTTRFLSHVQLRTQFFFVPYTYCYWKLE